MLRVAVAWASATLAFFLSAVLLVVIEAPGSGLAHILARLTPAPDVSASEFGDDLKAAEAAAPPARPALVHAAEEAAEAELRAAPMKPDAWLRLSYARGLAAGGYSKAAAGAFEQSYVAAPIDPPVAAWRVRFGLDNWRALSPSARGLVVQELETVWTADEPRRPALAQAVTGAGDLEGRSFAEALLTKLGWNPEKAP